MFSENYRTFIKVIRKLLGEYVSQNEANEKLPNLYLLGEAIINLKENADWGFWEVFKKIYIKRIEKCTVEQSTYWLLDGKYKKTIGELIYDLEVALNVRCRMSPDYLEQYIGYEKLGEDFKHSQPHEQPNPKSKPTAPQQGRF
ncbi:MAG: hypothetical protein PUP93_25375 [Rhizonema sp. NSF051]|nr:hypothetical protein [Rhizonema sp. NSF051]